MIPYGRHDISQQDVEAVIEVLQSEFLTQGPKVPEFERSVGEYCQVDHAIAVNSATSALHIACLALGVSNKDLVWTSPITYVATANSARYCGADVDFVDIDPLTFNISVERLENKLEQASVKGKLPKVVIPVHMCGQSCDMAAIGRLAQKYGFSVIEDASHAIGGKYRGSAIGECKYSDITVFSFHPVKIITTAEGGIAVTNNEKLAHRMSLFRSNGVTKNEDYYVSATEGPWYYQQIELGYNYRMTDIQAALGLSQMTRLDDYINRRHELAQRYFGLLGDLPIRLPHQNEDTFSSFHLYVIRLDLENIGKSRKTVFTTLRELGIGVNVHYIPVHKQPYYMKLENEYDNLPEAEQYYREAMSIPIFPQMTAKQQDKVIEAVQKAVN